MPPLAQQCQQLGCQACAAELRVALGVEGEVKEQVQHLFQHPFVFVGHKGDQPVGQVRLGHLACVLTEDAQLLEEGECQDQEVAVVSAEHGSEHLHDAVVTHLALRVDVLRQVKQHMKGDVQHLLLLAPAQLVASLLLRVRLRRPRLRALALTQGVALDLQVHYVHHQRARLELEQRGVEVGVGGEGVEDRDDVDGQVEAPLALVVQQARQAAQQPVVLRQRLQVGRLACQLQQQPRRAERALHPLVAAVDVLAQRLQARLLLPLLLHRRAGAVATARPRAGRNRGAARAQGASVLLVPLQVVEQLLHQRPLALGDELD
mmetsp:Transcript_21760/g.55205  ORF Transcript_21760/g.55205 Transcript_21760/m.55205 type:complete len:319 (+) Transcript_21760:1309-2265(+)